MPAAEAGDGIPGRKPLIVGMRDPELSIPAWLLLGQASTLRERTFCRLVEALDGDSIRFTHTPQQIFQIHPVESNLVGLMMACSANTWSRDRLANVPDRARGALGAQ